MGQGVSEGGSGRDGRRLRRVAVDLAATLGGRSSRAARVLDASRVGCLLRSETPLDVGAVVDLRIELPDGVLRAKARVAETSLDGTSLLGPARRYLAGLEFLGLAAADERRLLSFLETATKRRPGAGQAPT
jgi:hypothetical protein